MQEAEIMTEREAQLRRRVELAIRQLEDETKLQARNTSLLNRFSNSVAAFFRRWLGRGKEAGR